MEAGSAEKRFAHDTIETESERSMKRFLSLSLIILLAVAAGRSASDSTEVIGLLRKITPPAALRSKTGRVKSLKQSDEGQLVFSGDAVRATGSGEVAVDLADGTEVSLHPSDGWRTLSAGTAEKSVAHVREALNEISTLGGVERATPSPLSPAEGSAVRADHFILAWTVQPSSVLLTLRCDDAVIWKHTESGAAGRLDSESVRTALRDLRDKKGGEIIFQLQDSDGNERRSSFYLLSAEQERQLEIQLAGAADLQDPVIRALVRGYLLSSHKLFQEAAQEYRAASLLIPESEALRKAALAADTRAGFATNSSQ
jgi:hypothetical protein